MPLSRRTALAAPLILAGAGLAAAAKSRPPVLAPTPPMGWNSWNSFATTITEDQALETARIMAERLLPHGYDVFTIDIQWYEPEARSYAYNTHPVPEMDGYGRLLPAPNRFPSSSGGKGFKAIADQIRALGLKFGVHLMRGIPRLAVERNLPVLGTKMRAGDIANRQSTCPWNPDMYGVDMTRSGAQAYYDSVFALFASWGVDFVKMDDMSRPYDAHAPEIEAAHAAIRHSGRPIVLSLSPGETPLHAAGHVQQYAQMWRISDDFWDEWPLLKAQFARLDSWNAFRRSGAWPDADMLPLGRLALGERDTRFTPDEQKTVMTLWSIARSPLIMGGDLRALDAATLDLLSNDEVLAVNQNSRDNRPWQLADDLPAWTASGVGGRYLALFNVSDIQKEARFDLAHLGLKSAKIRDLWARSDLGRTNGAVTAVLPPHGCTLYSLT